MKFAAIQIQQLNSKKLESENAASQNGQQDEIEDAKKLVKELAAENREFIIISSSYCISRLLN